MVQRFSEANPDLAEYILGRHARAKHNIKEGVATFAGGRVDSELTDEGIDELAGVVEKLVNDGGCDIIAHSVMTRSRHTAEIVADGLEKQLGKKSQIIELKDLQEVDVGELTNHTGAWSLENYPKEANEFYNGDIHKWHFPNGESYEDAVKRVNSVLEQLKNIAEPGNKVIIIGHGMFDRVFLSVLMPDHPELWQPIDYPHDRLIAFQSPDEITVE